jgi:carotenoid cleavage dioxygenase-like enzyme
MKVNTPNLTKTLINLKSHRFVGEEILLRNHDFPIIKDDLNPMAKYLFSTEMGNEKDPMSFRGISRYDLEGGETLHYRVADNEIVGEAQFIEHKINSEDGHLIVPGYHSSRSQSFLDVVETKTMMRSCRIWCENYLPLGFHGNFVAG